MMAFMAWEGLLSSIVAPRPYNVVRWLDANSKKEWTFLAVALAGALLSIALAVFSHRLMHKLEQILADFEKNGATGFSMLEEKRESKLASRLQALLHRAELEKLQSSGERDAVAALLSDLSHQLKTPLANLMMYTELLEDGGLSEKEQSAFLHETRGQAEKMQWILKSMLKSSQLEQGIVSFPSSFTKVKGTIASAVGSVYAKACEKHICVVTEEFEDCRLYHNPKWTAEALGNILDNAIKYSPRDSQVTVRLCMLETYARIEVEDEGIGIGKTESNQIFKRFYRGEQAGQQEGNGLGLYLAQLILSKEKGYVTVKSQKGEGSCFQVYLLKEPGGQDRRPSKAGTGRIRFTDISKPFGGGVATDGTLKGHGLKEIAFLSVGRLRPALSAACPVSVSPMRRYLERYPSGGVEIRQGGRIRLLE